MFSICVLSYILYLYNLPLFLLGGDNKTIMFQIEENVHYGSTKSNGIIRTMKGNKISIKVWQYSNMRNAQK
jgi:hypothetical protein